MRIVAPLVALLLVSGCAHRLTMQSADGSVGFGTATVGAGSGSIEATIDGRRYDGRWTAATEGAVGFGTLLAGGQSVMATSMMVGGSRGMALMRSSDGKTMRCEFIYSGMSRGGYGVCEDGERKRYDLLIG